MHAVARHATQCVMFSQTLYLARRTTGAIAHDVTALRARYLARDGTEPTAHGVTLIVAEHGTSSSLGGFAGYRVVQGLREHTD